MKSFFLTVTVLLVSNLGHAETENLSSEKHECLLMAYVAKSQALDNQSRAYLKICKDESIAETYRAEGCATFLQTNGEQT